MPSDHDYQHLFVAHVGDLQISIVAAEVDGDRVAHAQIVSGDLGLLLPRSHLEDLAGLLDQVDSESEAASSEFFTFRRLGGSAMIQTRAGVQVAVTLSDISGLARLKEAIAASCESVRTLMA